MQPAERILFVDDEPSVCRAFARVVASQGYAVDFAETCTAAVSLAKETAYAVIAADYRMEEENGLDLIDQLASVRPDAVFLLISGQVDLRLALEAVNEHSVSYVIPKPWDVDQLIGLLQQSFTKHTERIMVRQIERNAVRMTQELEVMRQRLRGAAIANPSLITEALLAALNARGHETVAHCRRVAAYSLALAEALDVSGEARQDLERGALLHDIGTLTLPDGLIVKPGALTDEEWEQMRQHPEAGARLLDGLENLKGAAEVVQQHHERWDGTGYPRKLRGEQIVLGARIFAVADAIDAMTAKRAYQKVMSFEDAIADVRQHAGKRYDPAVVDALASLPPTALQSIYRQIGE